MKPTRIWSLRGALAALAVAGGVQARNGAVFTISNDPAGDAVLAFGRGDDGRLRFAGSFLTGGRGSGDGLGSQGALALSADGELLFAVDAGSNEITSFAVDGVSLRRVGHVSSGGTRPISLTVHDDLLYVLNAGGEGNIAGFTAVDGALVPLPGSTRPLSGKATGPAQIEFTPDGGHLVVTEKATDRLDVYQVGDDGRTEGPAVHASSGRTPFGFAFRRDGLLVVSEAFGGAAGASAVSSYALSGDDDTLRPISASVADHESAACWVVITGDGRIAFVSNTGSGSISAYRVHHDGRLVLLDSVAGSTGAASAPIDMALTRGSRFLYVLDSGTAAISAFRVRPGGDLEPVPGVSGLPRAAVGLAAR